MTNRERTAAMTRYRRVHRYAAAHRDDNEPEIIETLEACGVAVWTDLPVDLLCFHRGRLFAVEIKDGSKSPSRRKLTDREQDFIDMVGKLCPIVASVEQAMACTVSVHMPCTNSVQAVNSDRPDQ